jgi:uncharacterized protein DUF3828
VLGAAPVRAQDGAKALPPPPPSPTETFVEGLYKPYLDNTAGDPVQPDGQAIYSKRLQALIDKDLAETPDGEVGRLDFDPFVDGQDWELGGLKVKEIYRSGDDARVRADFANFGEPRSILFNLVREDGAWRVDEIASMLPPPWTLSEILTGAPGATPEDVGE